MAKARKILNHVRSIRNIRTVTKTMEMVSTARFRQSHNRVTALHPYTQRATDLVADLLARAPEGQLRHVLIDGRADVKRDVLFVLTGNRGLAGAYNSSVVRLAMQRRAQLLSEDYEVLVHASGKKGIAALRGAGCPLEQAYTQFDQTPEFSVISDLADRLTAAFTAGTISGVEVAYMQFISSARQQAAIAQVLPLSNLERPPEVLPEGMEREEYEMLPSPAEILDTLLPALVRVRLYQCFLDAAVSEQVARMSAMRAATENADEMIRHLTVRYNRTRQGQITNELAEIMGGSEGMQE